MNITLTINHTADTTDALAEFGRKLIAMFGGLTAPAAVEAAPVAKTEAPAPVVAPVAAPVETPAPPTTSELEAISEKKTRVRRTKEQIAADEAAKAAVAAPPPAAPAPAPAAAPQSFFAVDASAPANGPDVTKDDAKRAFIALAMLPGGDMEIADIMLRLGTPQFANLSEAQYGTAKVQFEAATKKLTAARG